jgi:methyltransferase (TIGR00027 family)
MAETLLDVDEVAAIEAEMATWAAPVRAAFRLAHATRARLAEDAALDGLAAGRRDYVLLGAGLDTFAWRHPRASRFTVWELDHPATQSWKRAALHRTGLGEPSHVRFVPIDLTKTAIDEIGPPPYATWSWLGVTMYLEPRATTAILRAIAGLEAGTTLVVNFLLTADELDDLAVATRSVAVTTAAADHEPVLAAYTRGQVAELLADAGFSTVELLDAGALAGRYFAGRDDLRLPNSTIIAVAST